MPPISYWKTQQKVKNIRVSKSAHGTTDVVLYNINDTNVTNFFWNLDIWGSKGYDRFHDGGIYFEYPSFVYDFIEAMPFISREQIILERI